MPRGKLNGLIDHEATTQKQMLEMARSMPTGANLKAAHLLNLAVTTYKHLVLTAESDSVRLSAARAIVELPFVQAKLAVITSMIRRTPSLSAARLDPAIEERLSRLLANGDETVILDAIATVDEPSAGPKSDETRESS